MQSVGYKAVSITASKTGRAPTNSQLSAVSVEMVVYNKDTDTVGVKR